MKKWIMSLLCLNFVLATMAQGQGTSSPSTQAPATPTATSEKVSVYSFLEWKSARVHEAQQKLETLSKTQGHNQSQVWQEGKSADTNEDLAKTNEQKLTFNVDVALQLNIHDYFSMYLKMLSLEEFKEATKKLTEDEKSELLIAYKNNQDKEKKLPLKFSKSPKDNAKSKASEIQ
jgi:hypothetical protein